MSFPLRPTDVRRLTAALLLASSLAGRPAFAQSADHLECYRGHDNRRMSGVVDIDSAQFGLSSDCRIKNARFFCAPAAKSVVEVSGAPILPVFGGPVPGDFVCYQVRCPNTDIPGQTVTDQFGTRVFKLNRRSFLLCTPAVKGTEYCGDGIANGSEACDGSDAASCPGACQRDCTCAPGSPGPRFVDNGDGTVMDNQTKLQWEKKDNLGGGANLANPHDGDNQYQLCNGLPVVGYSCDNGTGAPDGSAFTMFLAQLNVGTSSDGTAISGCFANHCDWRLPTSAELQTIVVTPCQTLPCIDPIFGPTPVHDGAYYWSATTSAADPLFAWAVSFQTAAGFPLVRDDGPKQAYLYVRAVRGGS